MPKASNTAIVAALIESSGNVTRAAEKVGLTPRAVRNRLKNADVRREYSAARDEMLQGACTAMQVNLNASVSVLIGVMNDPANSPQTRLNAATSIIDRTLRLSELCEILPRIEALERREGIEK